MIEKSVERRNHAWFALVDADRCRLLCCRLTQEGILRVVEYCTLENTPPEGCDVTLLPQAGQTHRDEENEGRFITGISHWLQNKTVSHELDRLAIFAAPQMLGRLQNTPFGVIQGRKEEIRGDLMQLSTDQLAEHPLVRELVRDRQLS